MDVRVAVVTGGGTGIGRAVAATLVARGDRVAILGRRPEVVVDANLKGPFLMSRATLPHLRRPGGRIVNLSSIAAWSGRGGPYAAAKAGVAGLTYSLALELGPLGITANAVAPGFIEDTEFFGGGLSEQGRRQRVDRIPAGRPGHPDEIAAAVAYLTSPEAGYVNGGWLFGR